MDGRCDGLPGQGGLEQFRSAGGQSGGDSGGAVHLEVIGVSIAATGVVADQDVDALVIENVGDPPSHLLGGDVCQALGVLAMQSGVRIAQLFQTVHSEDVG